MGSPKRKRTLASRKDAAGRSTTETGVHGFVKMERYLMDTPAWRALPANARALYLELENRYTGKNNGKFFLSVRAAAALCNLSKNTVPGCFATLIELGFIECAQPGSLGPNGGKTRHASVWRLTRARCDATGKPPSKAFRLWRPDAAQDAEARTNRGTTLSQIRDKDAA